MNGHPPSFASVAAATAVGSPPTSSHQPFRHASRSSLDSTPNGPTMQQGERNGSIPMPVGHRPFGSIGGGDMAGMGPTGMPRSPPKNKNTAHVPCKFFLQGQCQAGRMCPFSHNLESTTRPTPCKYFAKGGCKFGRKCALLHITPDGTVVNRQPHAPYSAAPPFASGPQNGPGTFSAAPPGLLSMQAQGLEQRPNGDHASDYSGFQFGARNAYDQPVDMTFTSASPKYGSPTQLGGLGASPPQQGLSVLDAPLPNSFDSNGVSMAARNGPFAASMPSRFYLESPPSSLPRTSQFANTALRDLHSSAFGDRGMDGLIAGLGSSPPSGTDEPITFQKRPLHSDRFRAASAMVSASLGTKLPTQSFEYSDDEDDGTDREEDLLPASLRDLIPENRSRRESKSRLDDDTPANFLSAARRTLSNHGTPQDSKLVTPHSSSPSRYNNVFARTTSDGNHAGSPLRNSGFFFGSAPKFGNGELSPTISSPPRQASMSMLTQELQRTKLDAKAQNLQSLPPHSAPTRTLSNGSTGGRSSLDRGMSSTSVGKIDEEQEVFDMDELCDPARATPRSLTNGEANFGAIGGHRSAK